MTVDQLLQAAVPERPKRNWFFQLSEKDQQYIRSVAEAMRTTPDAAPWVVARLLKDQLGINRTCVAIVRTLKELIANG